MANAERVLKVVVLGEAGVGKTSMVEQFVNNFYTDSYETTINIDVRRKQITVDGQSVTLEIWDTAGCERFHSLSVGFYRGAVCCVLMYDVTQPKTFSMMETWRDNFLLVVAARQPDLYPFVVIGNKIDLPGRTVTTKRAEQWCASQGNLPYFETSARKALNVDVAFQAVARRALGQLAPPSTDPTSQTMQESIRVGKHDRRRVGSKPSGSGKSQPVANDRGHRTNCSALTVCGT